MLDQATLFGRVLAAVLYLLGARWSEHSGNPALVLRAGRVCHYDCRSFFGITIRRDGSLAWVAGDLQLIDGLEEEEKEEEVVDEKRYQLCSLRYALVDYLGLFY